MDEKLKPCPFCGCEKVFVAEENGYPAIVCENCLVGVSACPDEALLIEIWNRRVSDGTAK